MGFSVRQRAEVEESRASAVPLLERSFEACPICSTTSGLVNANRASVMRLWGCGEGRLTEDWVKIEERGLAGARIEESGLALGAPRRLILFA